MITIYVLVAVALAGMALIAPWGFGNKSTRAWRSAGWGMIAAFPAMAVLVLLQGLLMFGVWSV